MRKPISGILILLALFVTAKGQSPVKEPILEVYETGAGMVNIRGRYLFLRVHADGLVEYEERVEDAVGLIKREYHLGEREQEGLKTLLTEVLAGSIPREFEPDTTTIDHVIREDIRININSKTKSITLVNFAPRLSEDSEKYSAKLLELKCSIRAMRARKTFRMLANDCILTR
jgi:hypothetical protein